MKAWRVYGPHDVRLDDMDSQPVGENCVKLKLLHSAISLNDVGVYDGSVKADYPIIIGRHGIGMVTEVGEGVRNLSRGDKVAVSPHACCHACANCLSGKTADCDKTLTFGETEDGFLRDFAVVSADDVFSLPDRIELKDANFLEHIAMAVNTVGKLDLEKGEHIVIVGAGINGIALAQVAMYYQAVPILVDMHADKLELASRLGVYYTVNSVETDPFKKIFSLTGGRMAETVAYIAGGSMPFGRTLDYAAKGGRVAVVGWHVPEELNAPLSTVMTRRLTVMGVSDIGRNLSSAINMLANKSVNVSQLISREIGFDECGTVIEEMAANPGKYIKVVVHI